jgi:hypothetical protein
MAKNFHGGIQTPANLKGTPLEQCREVDDIFYGGASTCCSGTSSAAASCDNETGPNVPQFGIYGFHMTNDKLFDSWADLETTICYKQSPFLFFSTYGANDEHNILVFGYHTSVNHVFAVDPLDPVSGPRVENDNPTAALDFDIYFQGGDSQLTHTRDYYDICPVGSLVSDGTGGKTCPIIFP